MSSLDTLFSTPPARIVADLQALREERRVIESQESMLEQILEMHERQGGEAADEVAELGASVAIGPLRAQILQVLRTRGDTAFFVPKDVHAELEARGNRKVTLDNVRMTMKRMADVDELERLEPNTNSYGLPGAGDTPNGRAFRALREGETR
jgi:hypothetical protein